MKSLITAFFVLVMTLGAVARASAQEASQLPPTDEEQQKEKTEKEKKAFGLLEQVVDEAQMLRLPENRIRVQLGAADLLWQRNEGRARSLFSLAADGVAEMLRGMSTETPINERRNSNQTRIPTQLRQELVLTVARHDATLAYQLLAATRPTTPTTPLTDPRISARSDQEDNLEQRLLEQVAALDPKLALQNAEQMLDKGQYSRSLAEVLAQLQLKDKETGAKLEDKMLKRLASANMLATQDAGSLALSLLQAGPRATSATSSASPASNQTALLAQSGYEGLLGTVIDAALKATPSSNNNQRGSNNPGGRNNNPGGGGGGRGRGTGPLAPTAPTDAQVEQDNARRLLAGLQRLLPQVDQYAASRAPAVRQKIADLGIGNSRRANLGQVMNGLQQGSSDSILSAAAVAPPTMQARIYQQAALKAAEEGNPDRARQIANDHLAPAARESFLQTLELRQAAEKSEATKIDDVRQTLARLRNDDERLNLLLELSGATREKNPEFSLELLDEAKRFAEGRASSYQQFERQLKVAVAFKEVQPARSFEVIEPGILQLNELLAAAATLSGFELNVFRDGELPLEPRNDLSNMVNRYGQTLGALAPKDFDRAQTLANRFHLTESRILARMAIVRGMLGINPTPQVGRSRRFGGADGFNRLP